MKNSFTLFLLFCVNLLLLSVFTYGSTTGKLTGRITEAGTGEPLVGINIILEGTTMGAATDLDGYFLINNVPPGNYVVAVSGIGYQKKRFIDVRIAVDFTTQLDVVLETEVYAVEAIVVQAQAPMVRKDQTSSRATVSADQIATLPVESVTQILSLQAGIVQGTGGELHIRGGRSTEIAYTINGVAINNPFDNSRSVQISTNAIQELSVVSGTFNAEYGNALSGVVNTVTKEGGNNFKGSLTFYTGDYVSTRKEVFFNVEDVNPINNAVYEFTLGGPVPFTNNSINFFWSGRYNDNKGWLYGVRKHNITDSVYKNPQNPNDIRIAMTGDRQKVAMNPSKDLNLTSKLTFKPTTMIKINYDVIFSQSEYKSYSHDYKYNPDATYNYFDWGILNALEFRHALSSRTFYAVKASYNFNDYKRYLFPLEDENGNEVSFYPGMDMTNLRPSNRYQPSHKSNRAANYTFSSGGTLNGHFYQRTQTIAGKFDLTSQLHKNHEVKMGADFKLHTLEYQDFVILYDTVTYKTPTIPPTTTSRHDLYTKKPKEISAYIQDKMEFESMIINLGLRYDYFASESDYSTNTDYPSPNKAGIPSFIDKSTLLAKADVKHQFSPRFGISFPITDKGIIHFSYGHFYQMPPFRYLYANPNFKYDFGSGSPIFGNANLNPEKTVSYEIGLQQQLLENLAFNVTAFYKDVRDLLALQQIRISSTETYFKYVNQDYGNIKGITFALTKRKNPDDLFGATLDYTYQTAEGNETGSDAFFLDIASGRQSEKIPVLLNWDQTHTLNGTLTIGERGNWNVTFVGKLGSGLPYTPELITTRMFLRTNSGRRPTRVTVDVLADKTFNVFNLPVTVFLKVFNLFDTLNERLIYNDTGRSTYTLESIMGTAITTDKLAEEIDGIEPTSDYFNRPNYYYPPRQVRLGVSLNF